LRLGFLSWLLVWLF